MKNMIIATITLILLSSNSVLAARFCLDVGPDLVILINKPLAADPFLNTGGSSCLLHGKKSNIN